MCMRGITWNIRNIGIVKLNCDRVYLLRNRYFPKQPHHWELEFSNSEKVQKLSKTIDSQLSQVWLLACAILEFYFRFRRWPHHCSRRALLHQLVKFHPPARRIYDVISIFNTTAVGPAQFTVGNDGPPTKCILWSRLDRQISDWSD